MWYNVRIVKQLLSKTEIPTMKKVHEDSRRVIHEVNLEQEDDTTLRVTSINVHEPHNGKPIVLGNHFHDKDERFTIMSGSPTLLTKLPNEKVLDVRAVEGGDIVTMQVENLMHLYLVKKV
jgi:hypothetical protein